MNMTKGYIITNVTKQYLLSLNLNTMTNDDLDRIELDLLPMVQDAFDEYNALCDKNRRLLMPDCLPNTSIAAVILHIFQVKCIRWSNRDDSKLTVIYQKEGENEGLYVEDDDFISSLIRRLKRTATLRDIGEIKDTLRTEAPLVSRTVDKDLIAVNNGIFNYRTKELLPFSPDYIFTAKCKVNYVPGSLNPVIHNDEDGTDWDVESWMQSLSDDPETVNLLWRVVGAVIRPHVRWDKMVMLYSQKGMNGKGTLCELMKQLCGEGAYAAIPLDSFERDFMLSPLMRCTAIITDENPTTEFSKNPANLKAVITGDDLQINRKHKEPVTFRFSGLMVQCINGLPKFGDTTDSLYRRFLIIPFNKTFMGCEKKYIKEDYLHRQDVLEYVLCKVLNMDYYEFHEPVVCRNMLADYKAFNDLIREFIGEMLPKCVWKLIPWEFLYDLYKAWMKRNAPSAYPQTKKAFIRKVKDILESDYPEFKCDDNPHRVTSDNMADPETLIAEYGLTGWANPYYAGSDKEKISNPALKDVYRGILRIK